MWRLNRKPPSMEEESRIRARAVGPPLPDCVPFVFAGLCGSGDGADKKAERYHADKAFRRECNTRGVVIESCCVCGASVALGAPGFAGRRVESSTLQERAVLGAVYPCGDFTCGECVRSGNNGKD